MAGLQYGMNLSRYCRSSIALTFLALAAATAWACQVPVFRYALERWEPGLYLARVPEGAKLETGTVPVNVEDKPTADVTELQLFYPGGLRQASDKPIWSAPMTEANVRRMIDSPARQELQKRLLTGESAIWVLLESGDKEKNDAAAKLLEEALRAAEEKLELPDGVITQEEASNPNATRHKENADVLQSDLPLKIAFSTLRLSRNDEAEAAFLAMLTHIEPDLQEIDDEPMVFPIFGRGRALEPLIGRGIHADNVLEAAAYLCGACSCEIKEQNPGIDLLMAADWAPVDNAPKVETVQIEPKPAAEAVPPGSKLIPGLLLIVLLVAALLLLKRK